MYHGKPTTGCSACRERRAARKHLVVYGYAVAHDEGNGKRPPPVCPVCGEERAVMTLCRCERLLEAGSLRPEDFDKDYRARYRDDLPPEFPSQL
jgi:hypothetical protein